MWADIHEVEPTGNGLQNPKSNEQAAYAAKSAVGVYSSQDCGKDGDQKVRSSDIRACRIEARHHHDRRQKAKQTRQNVDPNLNTGRIDARVARRFKVGTD